MTISKDLFLAILALDSYNRGYGAGIADTTGQDPDGLGDASGTKIGNASISARSSSDPTGTEVSEGFYALAYTLTGAVGEGSDTLAAGTTVISYRGTDHANPFTLGSDFWNGWLFGAGATFIPDQLSLARDFYTAVTQNNRKGQDSHIR